MHPVSPQRIFGFCQTQRRQACKGKIMLCSSADHRIQPGPDDLQVEPQRIGSAHRPEGTLQQVASIPTHASLKHKLALFCGLWEYIPVPPNASDGPMQTRRHTIHSRPRSEHTVAFILIRRACVATQSMVSVWSPSLEWGESMFIFSAWCGASSFPLASLLPRLVKVRWTQAVCGSTTKEYWILASDLSWIYEASGESVRKLNFLWAKSKRNKKECNHMV